MMITLTREASETLKEGDVLDAIVNGTGSEAMVYDSNGNLFRILMPDFYVNKHGNKPPMPRPGIGEGFIPIVGEIKELTVVFK